MQLLMFSGGVISIKGKMRGGGGRKAAAMCCLALGLFALLYNLTPVCNQQDQAPVMITNEVNTDYNKPLVFNLNYYCDFEQRTEERDQRF